MNDSTFEGVIVSKEDFAEYTKDLNQEQKDYIWQYAKRKMSDILLQDYELCLEACVEGALDRMNLEVKENLYDKGEL